MFPEKKWGWLLDKTMKIKEENPKADTNELENEIDKLVYDLYELAAAEIEIIEESIKT